MYVFQNMNDRDLYKEVKENDRCAVGSKRYVYAAGQWRELVSMNAVSLERESVVNTCTCENCGCGDS